jgi:hypothetical protein
LLSAEDPPADLAQRAAARETETEKAQSNYLYRQTVTIDEIDKHGAKAGSYQETREVIFSPRQDRAEQMVGKPLNTLFRIKMTDEDFRDIREIQPFLLTTDRTFLYQTQFRGEETIDHLDCYVLQIRPRQILDGMRLFEGLLWVLKKDFSIVRSEGKAVPEIRTTKAENLFPHFTTIREKVDGELWFPTLTFGDDTLEYRDGAQRLRMTIRYSDYRKFGSDTKVTFGK